MGLKGIGMLTMSALQSLMQTFITAWASTMVGQPSVLTLSPATAYQATDPTKSVNVTINVTSTAQLTLGGGQTHTAQVVIGPTAAVASGTGTIVARYTNSQTGAVVVGVALNAQLTLPLDFTLPAGWFYAVIVSSGAVTITSAFEQAIG